MIFKNRGHNQLFHTKSIKSLSKIYGTGNFIPEYFIVVKTVPNYDRCTRKLCSC